MRCLGCKRWFHSLHLRGDRGITVEFQANPRCLFERLHLQHGISLCFSFLAESKEERKREKNERERRLRQGERAVCDGRGIGRHIDTVRVDCVSCGVRVSFSQVAAFTAQRTWLGRTAMCSFSCSFPMLQAGSLVGSLWPFYVCPFITRLHVYSTYTYTMYVPALRIHIYIYIYVYICACTSI